MIKQKRRARFLLIFLCASVAALIYASHLIVYHRLRGETVSWGNALAHGFVDWYSWAILSPVILWFAARFPLDKRVWKSNLLLHIPGSLFFALLQVCLHATVDQLLIHQHYRWIDVQDQIRILIARTYHFGLLVYWLIVIVRNAVEYYKQQELTASRLETQLAQSQLQTLRMQLHPHFLFNTLNAIQSLLHQDAHAADRMIATLSDLLRLSLQSSSAQEVTLRQEIDFLKKYLEIEQVRFPDRLNVQMSISPDLNEAAVPNLVLQPIVENAIRHGIAKTRGQGILEVSARSHDGMLELRVRDNGKGIAPSVTAAKKRNGIGLANTRARLQQLYGEQQSLQIRPAANGGTEVLISIPLHETNETG